MRVLLMTGEEKDSSSFYDSGNQAVTGVLIAAEGADNSVVSRNIVEGVMALFQLDAHKIKVMKNEMRRGKVKKDSEKEPGNHYFTGGSDRSCRIPEFCRCRSWPEK